MRIDTDDLERARGRKKVGRKHLHQPRGRALQKRLLSPFLRQKLDNIKRHKFSRLVAAYWRGEIKNYPTQGE